MIFSDEVEELKNFTLTLLCGCCTFFVLLLFQLIKMNLYILVCSIEPYLRYKFLNCNHGQHINKSKSFSKEIVTFRTTKISENLPFLASSWNFDKFAINLMFFKLFIPTFNFYSVMSINRLALTSSADEYLLIVLAEIVK